jgi:formylmethanofuran dehydrogenase subunit A
MLRIINGRVYDPANGIQGEIRDVYIDGGRIVSAAELLPGQAQHLETVDASGCAVMPGGVEIHSHVAGAKVNTGRIMCPEDHYDHTRTATDITRAGCGNCLPTTFMTGYLYSQLGYTTIFEAAVPPLEARHAHEEFVDIPLLDKGCFTVMGNNYLVMKTLSDPDQARRQDKLRELVSWLLRASRAYAVKVVNPGGVESWKWHTGAVDLDTQVAPFGVSPRQIITGLATAADELRLPHPMHLHCNHLGEPGNIATTLDTMRALEGHRAHFTHLQYHSYAKTKKGGFASGAAQVAEYFNQHPEFTCDVGQVVFGSTLTMTSDAPMEFKLHQMQHNKWANCDIEMECGSGLVPVHYRPGVLVNAIQWSVGLELLLLIKDPWRIFLTTDHPNAGPFTAYPLLIRLLMDLDYRRSWLEKLHPRAKRVTCLADLDREYTLEEIAIITRAGQARALGLHTKGHLGPGADADVAVYPLKENRASMFAKPRYVFKQGQLVIRDGKIIQSVSGRTLYVDPPGPRDLSEDLAEAFVQGYSVELANYKVQDEYLPQPEVVPCG